MSTSGSGRRRSSPAATSWFVTLTLVAAVVLTGTAVNARAAGVIPAASTPGTATQQRHAVDFGRWLDLRIGMTARTAIATGKVRRNATPCRETGLISPWNERGHLWFSGRDRLLGITLFERRDRTARGLGVGSTLESLRRAYPRSSAVRARTIEGYRLPYVFVRRDKRTLTFQFATDTRVRPSSRVTIVSLSRTSPRVLWEAC